MKQKKNGRIKLWKWLFLILLAMNVGLALVLVQRVTTSREDTNKIASVTDTGTDAKIGSFSTTRDQLNETISAFLTDYQTKDFSYKVYATKQLVLFEGTYKLLGVEVPLAIYFQPSKLEDGSVLLTVSEISAGTLSIPKAEILSYLKKSYKLPEFVSIDVDAATILVNLPAIENKFAIYVKANTIDLYNDSIVFDIYRKK